MNESICYTWSLPVTLQTRRSHHLIYHSLKPHATGKCKPHGSMFYRMRDMADGSFTSWVYAFSTIFAPVSLALTQWSSYMNLTCIPSRCSGCVKMNFICQAFRKLSYFTLQPSRPGFEPELGESSAHQALWPVQWFSPLSHWDRPDMIWHIY